MDPTTTLIVIVVVGWLSLGLFVGLWMVRRGHDPLWVVIAVALGPIFVPVALERVERHPRLATTSAGGVPPAHSQPGAGPRVLGSVSSELVHHSRVPVLVVEPAGRPPLSGTGTAAAVPRRTD